MYTSFKLFENAVEKKVIHNFPELRQIFTYDCGASALQSVMTYYGVEKREDELMKMLHTSKIEAINIGTKIKKNKRSC